MQHIVKVRATTVIDGRAYTNSAGSVRVSSRLQAKALAKMISEMRSEDGNGTMSAKAFIRVPTYSAQGSIDCADKSELRNLIARLEDAMSDVEKEGG